MNSRRLLRSGRRLIHQSDRESDKETTSPASSSTLPSAAPAPPPDNEPVVNVPHSEAPLADDEEISVEAYLSEIRDIEKDVSHSASDQNAISSADMTRAHQQRCQQSELSFISVLSAISKCTRT